jgi:septal ring factor EnvC (AmiA/AmiB activator)
MDKIKIRIAIITACGIVIGAMIAAIAPIANVISPCLNCQKKLIQTQEQVKQTQDSLNVEQLKVVQLKIELDRLNKSLNDCKNSLHGSVTKKEIISNLEKEGKRIKGNCTQPNIAKEFEEWKSKCMNQLTPYIPNIQNRIEDVIKNAPPNNYCVKTESIICLLDSLKKIIKS